VAPPDPAPNGVDVVLRPATDADAEAVSAVHLASRRVAAMPPSVHEDHEHLPFLRGRMAAGEEVWVAEADGAVVGYARFTDTWLDDLYVHPDHAGHGLGSALLDVVKARRPAGFALWVFEVNAPARAFYARHGLVEAEHTDGRDNEERAPDVRMVWAP
jgi:GNAT superfamily N-acetyltransferase